MWIQREMEPLLGEVARQRPVVVVSGCRQAGKSSLLRRVFPGHRVLSLDSPLLADDLERNPGDLLDRLGTPLVLDEVQYAPHLLRHIKLRVDARRQAMGQYLLTGSQKFQLMQGVTESLAGRVGLVTCHSLSAREIERHRGTTLEGDTLLEAMLTGGYPELHAAEVPRDRFFDDYLATYLERDVRHVLQVRSLRDFARFMRLLAARVGQLFSAQGLAMDLDVSPTTVKSWLAVLEASNVIMLLEPYFRNIGKRLVKTPKLYFLDTGLACYLAGIRGADELSRSSLRGPMFENHVVAQIVRAIANGGRPRDLYFYRDHHGHEVDVVLPVGEKLHLVECKWSANMPRSVPAFDELRRSLGADTILSATVVTPSRGFVPSPTLQRGDSIDLAFLDAGPRANA